MKSIISTLILISIVCCIKVQSQPTWTIKNPRPSIAFDWIHAVDTQLVTNIDVGGPKGQGSYVSMNGGKFWANKPVGDSALAMGGLVWPTRKVGFALSQFNYFCKTSDGGLTWKPQSVTGNIFPYHFADTINGYAQKVSTDSLYVTNNGGKSWTAKRISISSVLTAQSICALTPTTVLIGNRFKVYRSTNSGTSFQELVIPRLSDSLPGQPYPRIISSQNRVFIISGYGRYFRSLDYGQTWERDSIPTPVLSPWAQIYCLENNTIIAHAYDGKKLLISTNNGISWVLKSMPLSPYSGITSAEFLNPEFGFVWSRDGLFKTTNGGDSWQLVTKGKSTEWRGAGMAMQGQKTVWVPGQGWLAKSEDQGKTWNFFRISPGDSLSNYWDVEFPTPRVGYIAYGSTHYKTTNGGRTWKSFEALDSSGVNGFSVTQFHFLNKDTGYGEAGFGLIKTTNGGATWRNSFNAPGGFFNNVSVLDERHVFVVNRYYGQSDTIKNRFHFTRNGGQTWTSKVLQLGQYFEVNRIQFVDTLNGFMTALYNPPSPGIGNNFFFRTTDGGENWDIVNSGQQVREFYFESPTKGSCLFPRYYFTSILDNREPALMKTEDAGSTWTAVDTLFGGTYNAGAELLRYKNEPVVFVAGNKIGVKNSWMGVTDFVATGRVVKKENDNCSIESNETGRPNQILISSPGEYFTSTDSLGNYALDLDTGSFQIKQLKQSPVQIFLEKQFCPPNENPIPVNFSGFIDTLKQNNFINEVKNCPILVIHQDHFFMRPCRPSALKIVIENQGNIPSDSEMVHVKFPPKLHFVSSGSPYLYVPSDSTYRFKIKPLQPNESITFNIKDSVICDPIGLTGQILCVKAIIPNVPNCLLQSPNWDGADLEVASRCLPASQTRFTIRNKGNAMAAITQYQIFIDSALVYQAPFQLAANGSMSVTLPANAPAGFARMVVPQSANHPLSTFASAEANCATGISTNGMFPPSDQSPLVDIECVTITNAYDPNDKQVFPTGWGTAGNVEPGTEFKYTVRFQNTGSDTAFKVVLVDTLDEDLDIASLQIGNASHTFQFNVSGKGRPVLRWTFDNILLPDSNTNEEKSHGFVSYSVHPKAGLALGTRLENFADIYFDFNDPIRTNTTVNTLWQPTYTPGILDTVFVTEVKNKMANKGLMISPNPAVDVISIHLPEINLAQLEITDLQGRTIKNLKIKSGESVSVKDLKPGIYMMKMKGYSAERLVVNP